VKRNRYEDLGVDGKHYSNGFTKIRVKAWTVLIWLMVGRDGKIL